MSFEGINDVYLRQWFHENIYAFTTLLVEK